MGAVESDSQLVPGAEVVDGLALRSYGVGVDCHSRFLEVRGCWGQALLWHSGEFRGHHT